MRIAVEGCCHGKLCDIYATIAESASRSGKEVDLLLICGDMQATRNEADLNSMAVPDKYKSMESFYKYYTGEEVAPVLTIFIGGNHEASNHLYELHYGGWVAPNIYYMGQSGVVEVNGVKIGGLSGIYKEHDYKKGHFEIPPFSERSIKSIYHVREYDVWKMKQLENLTDIDIMLTHDWPRGIYRHGKVDKLLSKKPFFREEIKQNTLGSAPAEELLNCLKPKYWFAAHLHVKFAAIVKHNEDDVSKETETNNEEVSSSSSTSEADKGNENIDAGTATESESKDGDKEVEAIALKMTKFLSLDKCLPKRDFLQIFEIVTEYDIKDKKSTKRKASTITSTSTDAAAAGTGTDTKTDETKPKSEDSDKKCKSKTDKAPPVKFTYNREWLAITKEAHKYYPNKISDPYASASNKRPDVDPDLISAHVKEFETNKTSLDIPQNFEKTVAAYDPKDKIYKSQEQLKEQRKAEITDKFNPQTEAYFKLLGITHHDYITPNVLKTSTPTAKKQVDKKEQQVPYKNTDEINLEDSDSD